MDQTSETSRNYVFYSNELLMGKGRKKLPTKIKEMQGTITPSRIIENEMMVDVVTEIPEPPNWLSEIGKKEWEKVSSQLVKTITSRMKRVITSIDGNSEQAAVSNFVDNEFLSMDSLELRKHMVQITPDVNLTTTAKFDDGREEEVAVEITAQFFWPTA